MSDRRNVLKYLLSAMAGGGVVAASIPFVSFLNPAADKINPSQDIDISDLAEGEFMVVHWNLRPIYIIRRSKDDLEQIVQPNGQLLDVKSDQSYQPEPAKNAYRSIRPDIFLVTGICTHLGCAVTYRPDRSPQDLGPDWKGGFFCPCHGAMYDNSGRVFKGGPAPRNMDIPYYEFVDENTIRMKHHG